MRPSAHRPLHLLDVDPLDAEGADDEAGVEMGGKLGLLSARHLELFCGAGAPGNVVPFLNSHGGARP